MDYMRKEQVQDILESIVPSDWVQDIEEGLENVEKETRSDARKNQRYHH